MVSTTIGINSLWLTPKLTIEGYFMKNIYTAIATGVANLVGDGAYVHVARGASIETATVVYSVQSPGNGTNVMTLIGAQNSNPNLHVIPLDEALAIVYDKGATSDEIFIFSTGSTNPTGLPLGGSDGRTQALTLDTAALSGSVSGDPATVSSAGFLLGVGAGILFAK